MINEDPHHPAPPDSADTEEVREIPSEEILQGKRQVCILHNGERYRLVLTRNGKLLLQK